MVLSLPPSLCSTTSVVRLRALTLLTPATSRPSHLTRNLKFLYGSRGLVVTVCSTMPTSLRLDLACHLLDLEDHKLRRFQGGEADDDVDDALIDIVLGCGLTIALDEVSLPRHLALEG